MIGGKVTATIEKKVVVTNSIGAGESKWVECDTLKGYLDLATGDSHYTNYSAKVQESSHIFICDYKNLPYKKEELRAIIKENVYDVKLIDNPMEMDEHLEIYLDYVG